MYNSGGATKDENGYIWPRKDRYNIGDVIVANI